MFIIHLDIDFQCSLDFCLSFNPHHLVLPASLSVQMKQLRVPEIQSPSQSLTVSRLRAEMKPRLVH